MTRALASITLMALVSVGVAYGEEVRDGALVPGAAITNATVTVRPDLTTPVEMSNADINRLICGDDIREVIFSDEKGIKVKVIGRDAFVKFLVVQRGTESIYTATPSEFYVACGGEIYSMVALPKNIPPQTIVLSTGEKGRMRENAEMFAGLAFEKKVVKAIKALVTGSVPDSFTVREERERFDLFEGLDMVLRRVVSVDGEGLRVKEYFVEASREIEVEEKTFLRRELTQRPVGIALSRHLFEPGDTGRLFIVETVNEGGEGIR